MPDIHLEGNFGSAVQSDAPLRAKLAELLGITEAELPLRLKEVGQELAFHFAVNPDLYKQLAAALSHEEPHLAGLYEESTATRSASRMEAVRSTLLSKGISEQLKERIGEIQW